MLAQTALLLALLCGGELPFCGVHAGSPRERGPPPASTRRAGEHTEPAALLNSITHVSEREQRTAEDRRTAPLLPGRGESTGNAPTTIPASLATIAATLATYLPTVGLSPAPQPPPPHSSSQTPQGPGSSLQPAEEPLLLGSTDPSPPGSGSPSLVLISTEGGLGPDSSPPLRPLTGIPSAPGAPGPGGFSEGEGLRGGLQRVGAEPRWRRRRSWLWNQFFVIEEYRGPEPVLIGRLHTDMDRGDGRTKYLLEGEGVGSVFVIDGNTGNIHVTKALDREEKDQYRLVATATDRETGRALEPSSQFIIRVQDINDNPPVFKDEPYSATVPEMANIGTSVIQVTASDADDPAYGNSAKLVYAITQGQQHFSVDAQTGVLRTASPDMDRETQDEYLVVMEAKDMGGHLGGLSGTTTVTVRLSDVNDNPPRFRKSEYNSITPRTVA
ncbi:cadherin-24-like [Osmerus eperlanus]|uniref:cadherin-24-like n=1 Tax=Osmerus eperlanus TaxID=29151 RepID=UPI002E1100C2